MNKKMRSISHSSIIFVLIVVMLFIAVPVYAGDSSASDAYDYPIKTGKDEWKAFTNHEDMVRACQIPDDVLESISTAGLVETVLNYPLIYDLWAYDTPELGIEYVSEQFNGLSKLLNRKDAGEYLLGLYQVIDPEAIDISWSITRQTEYYIELLNIELLLSQDSIIAGLPRVALQSLISRAREIDQAKIMRSDIFSSFNQQFTSTIIEKASERQYSTRASWSHVHTPNNSEVEVEINRIELTTQEKLYYNNLAQTQYPNAILVADSSNRYNCHAFGWYYQGYQNRWMYQFNRYGGANVSKYWTDGSYGLWSGAPYNGLKVFYVYGDHSAVIYNITNHQYKSKWGLGPVMIHTPSYCPYNPSKLNYYYRTY